MSTIFVRFAGHHLDLPETDYTRRYLRQDMNITNAQVWGWVLSSADDPRPEVQELRDRLRQLAGPFTRLMEV